MLRLYQFPPAFGLPVSVSPFCAKLEIYFRLTGRDYETVVGDLRKSPNKLLPYVMWPDGQTIADSSAVVARLENEGPALDEGLSPLERELSEELTAAAEGPVYTACLFSRFVEDAGWEHQKPTVRALLPVLLAPFIMPLIRSSQKKRCAANGFSSRADYTKAVDAVQRISHELGRKEFLLGDRPRTVDCGVWANIMHSAHTRTDNPVRMAIRTDEHLTRYIDRVAGRGGFELPALS